MSELLIGCGNSRRKKFSMDGPDWVSLVTMDHDPNCGADIVHDLDQTPWPVESDRFDSVHAYEVLEHLGAQGDWRAFFLHFGEIYRVLKPGGHLIATVPSWKSQWAWADPSHTRIIAPGTLSFLSQRQYKEQIGKTAMTDFRHIWSGDFEPVHVECGDEVFVFVLEAIKPR